MESLCQTSQVTPQLLAAPRPLIKRQAETTPSGFLKVDIPRFPEPAPPHGDTDPATAERLGLDRRQMRDTIACSDGKGCLYLISLSSRRRGRCIAQMPPVRAGGWDCLLLPDVQFYFISGQHKNRAPKSPVFAISFSFATNQNPTGRFFTPYTQPLHLRWCSAPRREVSCR